MKNWILCPLVVFLALSPLESQGQLEGSAWVSFSGLDCKHIQYSFKDLAPNSAVRLYELVVQDPQGNLTVITSWTGSSPGPEGTYRLSNLATGNYYLHRLHYIDPVPAPQCRQLATFAGKTDGISGIPLFDETINGSGNPKIWVDWLQVATNVTLTLESINPINTEAFFEISGTLLLKNCRLYACDFSKGLGTLEASGCAFGFDGLTLQNGVALNIPTLQRVILQKCELGGTKVAGTNGIFEATDCTFKAGLVCLNLDLVTLKTCGVYTGAKIGAEDAFSSPPTVGALRLDGCVFAHILEGSDSSLSVAVSRNCRIENSEFHKIDLLGILEQCAGHYQEQRVFHQRLENPGTDAQRHLANDREQQFLGIQIGSYLWNRHTRIF